MKTMNMKKVIATVLVVVSLAAFAVTALADTLTVIMVVSENCPDVNPLEIACRLDDDLYADTKGYNRPVDSDNGMTAQEQIEAIGMDYDFLRFLNEMPSGGYKPNVAYGIDEHTPFYKTLRANDFDENGHLIRK